MKTYKKWQEDYQTAYGDAQVGPHTNITGRVASASDRFDKQAGESISKLPPAKKLRYLLDTIMSVTGDEEDIRQDRNLIAKLRTALIKLDAILKKQNVGGNVNQQGV
jgi:hypothetical protein